MKNFTEYFSINESSYTKKNLDKTYIQIKKYAKIIKLSYNTYWYKNNIGDVFPIELSGFNNDNLQAYLDIKGKTTWAIEDGDFEIVEKPENYKIPKIKLN
jgi:hypothetical protein